MKLHAWLPLQLMCGLLGSLLGLLFVPVTRIATTIYGIVAALPQLRLPARPSAAWHPKQRAEDNCGRYLNSYCC